MTGPTPAPAPAAGLPALDLPLAGLAVPDEAFETQMREVLVSDVEFIALIGEDLVTAGGKRVRPLIALLAAQALGCTPTDPRWRSALRLSVCVELLHSASLLHDDLIDESDTRRGRETAFRRFGNVVSVMSGDFMLAKLLMVLSELPQSQQLTQAFGKTASVVCEGEVLQFQVASYGDYSFENYFKVIYGKTAALLDLAACAPALMLGAAQEAVAALRTYGDEYGMAFQIQDDWLDLMGEEAQIGKPVGGDLREGKATYPTLLLLGGPDGEEVREILERRAAQPGDVERVRSLVLERRIGEQVRAEILRRTQAATQALHVLPDTPARAALLALAEREAQRMR